MNLESEPIADGGSRRHEDVLLWVSKELDGELSPREQVLLSDHLDGCHPCSQVRRELRGVRAAARTHERVLPPVGLVDRVVAHVLTPESAVERVAAAPAPLLSILRRSAAAAAALLLLLGGIYVGRAPNDLYAGTDRPAVRRLDPELERALTRWEAARSHDPSLFELLLPSTSSR